MKRVFGVSQDQVNLLTVILGVSAAAAAYDAARRIIRVPWPLDDGFDTAATFFVMREGGFALAGPRARDTQLFGALIAAAAIGSVTLPGMRRAAHTIRVTARQVGEQRMRIYGAAQRKLDESTARHR